MVLKEYMRSVYELEMYKYERIECCKYCLGNLKVQRIHV